MRNRNSNIILRAISVLLLTSALVVSIVALVSYSRQRNSYPAGMTIADVPVGGQTPNEARQRLLEVYTSPVEVIYGEAVIHIEPGVIGFQPDVEAMLAAADLVRTGTPFWGGMWNYIWSRNPDVTPIELSATFSEDRLREYLENEIVPRYDVPPSAPQPVSGQAKFEAGAPGRTLDINAAIRLIEVALKSANYRTVNLIWETKSNSRPTIDILETMLKQIVAASKFDGLIGLYMVDLQNGEEIHFAINNGTEIGVEPDIAFTASSTMKIPVVASYLINRGSDLPKNISDSISLTLSKSSNEATDRVLSAIDPFQGPIIVTRDMATLGLESTFLAGFFTEPAYLLPEIPKTPGNTRVDISTDPDVYSQTTPSEMGMLLTDIYRCSKNAGGALMAAFPEKMNPSTCQLLIDFMATDKLGSLIQGGVPDGTVVPHKHGYVPAPDGVVHDISDVGIVYTSGGDFVLSVYTYHPVTNVWDVTNPLINKLTEAIYNYFTID